MSVPCANSAFHKGGLCAGCELLGVCIHSPAQPLPGNATSTTGPHGKALYAVHEQLNDKETDDERIPKLR